MNTNYKKKILWGIFGNMLKGTGGIKKDATMGGAIVGAGLQAAFSDWTGKEPEEIVGQVQGLSRGAIVGAGIGSVARFATPKHLRVGNIARSKFEEVKNKIKSKIPEPKREIKNI